MSQDRILIVDDNEAARYALAKCLKQSGHLVQEVETGEECLRRVAESPPDLILLAVQLPDISGLEVCRRIKAEAAALCRVPVIQISALLTDAEERIAGLESGADVYLASPFEPRELLAHVEQLLRTRRAEERLRLDSLHRVRAEEELRENNRFINEVANIVPGIIYVFDLQKRENVYVNRKTLQVLGYSDEEISRLGPAFVPKVVHPDDAQTLEQHFANLSHLGDGVTAEVEYRFRHRDGSWLWFLSQDIVYRRGPNGEVRQVLGLATDISARKHAEERIRNSEERLSLAIHAAQLGTWDAALPGNRVVWNEDHYRILGYAPGSVEASDEAWIARVHPNDRARLAEAYATALQVGGDFTSQFRALWPDGTLRWIEARGHVEQNAQGQAVRSYGVMSDISERKDAEESIRRLNQRLQYHHQNTPLAVIDFNSQMRVSAWNEGAQRLFGWQPEEVLGRGIWELPWIHEEDRPHIQAVSSGLESGKMVRSVSPNRNVTKSGKVIWCEWYNSALTDAHGKLLSIQALVLDVTERKEFEAELERVVAERTAKLQELIAELEHFSYTITHDLKSPLRAMRGFAEMVNLAADKWGNPEAKEYLNRISTSAERMDALIRDALSYSQAVRQELPLEDVDAGALLRGMLESYPEFQACREHIKVQGPLPVVLANEAGLTQCFSNLLNNAIKFVPPGQLPHVRIWAETRDDWSRIWVQDQGVGISPEMLPRIFQMFSRANKRYEGTGIGLALVRKVTQRMGGRVGVESVEGKGSRFWVELKIGMIKPLAQQAPQSASAAGTGTVLYVEDEEGDAMFMERAFRKQGLRGSLRLVGDGRSAIDYLLGAGAYADRIAYPLPALVLLDLNLPELPGFEVLKWMRSHPDFSATPVLIFSSSSREDDKLKATTMGANGFVSKPGSGLEFAGIVEDLKSRWLPGPSGAETNPVFSQAGEGA